MFSLSSHALIYGRHLDVAGRMLDFDFLSGRSPSVAGIIDPSARRTGSAKVFFGGQEILIPVFPSLSDMPEDFDVDTFLNFASFRSAAEVTMEALRSERFDHIIIVAEGIPERDIRDIIGYNQAHADIRIIGPATAGAIAGGILRMGNSGGSLENIVASRLYQRGSVGFVSRSGGMSNEMYRVISNRTDGIHTGLALGGDRFVASTFRDIVLEYARDPSIRMIVMLGEVGSQDELEIVSLLEAGQIPQPVVAYVSGTFAEVLPTEVQFGHAGARANADAERASYKNRALRDAGAHVPESYADLGDLIAQVFRSIDPEYSIPQEITPEIQSRLDTIKKRKPTKFTSTISDERGEDVLYNGIPLTDYVSHASIARVIGALWLQRELPDYARDCLDTCIILLADHGPAVSGATNTIIAARAGKDILSSLVSGLMTIGPRFGGAIDGAAREFYTACRSGESPEAFVARMKKSGTPIPGIGHKVKSKFNPDGRCEILKSKAKNIPKNDISTPYGQFLTYALEVEALTLEKRANLILNVDGHIAAIFLDIFVAMGMTHEEIEMYIDAGLFNALFILSRSIGLIGHALDQKRLGEPLYRTAWEDIHYA